MEFTPRFYSKLQFEDDGGLPFTLLSPLTYVSNVDGLGTIVVPAGFKTDLASIPRGGWNVLPQVGKYDAPAVVHDYLYQQPPGAPQVNRGQADRVLREAMGVVGVGNFTCFVIYAGVRVGGWKPWNKYREGQS